MRTIKARKFAGFAIVDLAAILAISSLLMIVATPAMQSARDAARRNACKNNLKQLGLACHNYHDVYGMLPGSWYARYHQADSVSWIGWQVSLLPFVEQGPVYNSIRTFPEWSSTDAFASTHIPTYRCPSDTIGEKNAIRGGFGTSNYSGCAGITPFPRLYAGTAETYWPGGLDTHSNRSVRRHAGIFKVNSRTRFRDIVDGLSNTMMISERSAISGGGIWVGVRSNRTENDVVTEFSHKSRINKSFTGASSFHRGGFQVVLADGASRFVATDVASGPAEGNLQVLQAVACYNDGTVVVDF